MAQIRNARAIIRLPSDEKEIAKEKAELCGMSLSNYTRMAATEQQPKQKMTQDMILLRRALFDVLRNLTQISSLCNAKKLPLADEARAVEEDVRGRLFKLYYFDEGA